MADTTTAETQPILSKEDKYVVTTNVGGVFTESEGELGLESKVDSVSGKRLMVVVDGSEGSKRALDTALSYKKPEDLLLIVHCMEKVSQSYFAGLAAMAAPTLSVFNETNVALKKAARELVRGFAKICDERKVANYEAHLLTVTNSKAAAVEYARDHKVDLIVTGTRGLGTLQRIVVGSFSRHLIDNAHCDVLLVR